MRRRTFCLAVGLLIAAAHAQDLRAGFQNPPPDARPWVYWFWLNGNITREGITADLEAMARVGIGGVLIMEVDQGAPDGPAPFASDTWRVLFKHVAAEANRLGLQVNMNNDAGWCGSGGPWVKPEQAMQKLTWSETHLDGGQRIEADLSAPPAVQGFYRDVAVLAFPQPADDAWRNPSFQGKSAEVMQHVPLMVDYPAAPAGAVIARGQVKDVTASMAAGGHFAWDAPAGRWVILRVGHTLTGAVNAPAPTAGRGLESDKLSREATQAYWDGLMGKLCTDVGPLSGKSLVATHIDSWETGSQNWTPRMREQFQRLRGYDPLLFLPVAAGHVLDSLEVSERFLWDLRQTVSDLIVTEYAEQMRDLARQRGLHLTIEGYGEPAVDLAYGGRADEPMGEFWWSAMYGGSSTCTVMTSAGHVYGHRVIGAEAFTSDDAERWQGHPGNIKALGDWAFCEGINRFVFHRYALQPWLDKPPGMSMGPWGLHYERSNTWWSESGPWHQYLARCQWLLRQGLFVADVLYLAPEYSPAHYVPNLPRPDPLDRPGYNFDSCPAEALTSRVSVKDGRLALPDGMSYRVLALPDGGVMTPETLARVKALLDSGATVVGGRQLKSPSLADYPDCDVELKQIADSLWGGAKEGEKKVIPVGRGRLVVGQSAMEYLAATGVPEDFAEHNRYGDRSLRYIHRRAGDTDIYFVANKLDQPVQTVATFRVRGKRPELWSPETGQSTLTEFYRPDGEVTHVPLRFDAAGSVFVIFRQPSAGDDPVVSVKHGAVVVDTVSAPLPKIEIQKATYGPKGDPGRTFDVTERARRLVAAGARAFQVARMAEGNDPAFGVVKTLVVEYTVNGQAQVVSGTDPETISFGATLGVTVQKATYGPPGDPQRTLDVTDKVRKFAEAGQRSFAVVEMARPVDPANMVVKTLRVEFTTDGQAMVESRRDGETFRFPTPAEMTPLRAITRGAKGGWTAEVEEAGTWELTTAAGKTAKLVAAAWPAPRDVAGPWEVRFQPGRGAPERVRMDELVALNRHTDPGVRYFSGTATYGVTLTVPAELLGAGRKLWLDLGRVEVMAGVKLNGKDLGLLWHAPYRVDVSGAAKAGANALELRVTDTWINRLIGDEQLPDDSQRHGNGTCVKWPDWLYAGKPSPTGRYTFTSWRLWGKDSPLVDSGLIGPVRLVQTRLLAR